MLRFYFDHNATTPVSDESLEVYAEVSRNVWGNASSIHQFGQAAKQCLEQSRGDVAALLGCNRNEIVWTSGGTEADNSAIFGTIRKRAGHVITSQIEHPAVLSACRRLQQEGIEVTYLRVGSEGRVDPDAVKQAIRPTTRLVTIMHVNNETGVIQPIEEIAAIGNVAGTVVHSDGVQAAGRLPVDVCMLGVDLYSISAHKVYGPKGCGALFVRKGVELDSLMYGGRHERGKRAGTENVAGAAAFGAAAKAAAEKLTAEPARIARLRDRLEASILDRIPDVSINGAGPRVANTSSLCFRGIEGEALVIALDLKGFSISSGSACSSGAVEPSHVLLAMGMSKADAKSSVRISLGRSNDEAQVDGLCDAIVESVAHLRRLSPVYVHG